MSAMQRKSRGLVIGYLEGVPARIFVDRPGAITSLVGAGNGVYVLYRNKQVFHIGIARSLARRARQHVLEQQAGKWNRMSLYVVRGGQQLGDLTALALRIVRPGATGLGAGFATATDLSGLLSQKLGAIPGARPRAPARKAAPARGGSVPLAGLLRNRLIRLTHKGKVYTAAVLSSGRIKLKRDGRVFDTPSGAARAIVGFSTNGWHWWRYRTAQGAWVPIHELRT